jgi:hypothetical protein
VLGHLLDWLVGESINVVPKRALGAGLAIRIVLTFFVRAPDYPVCGGDRLHFVWPKEICDLATDLGIMSDIGVF